MVTEPFGNVDLTATTFDFMQDDGRSKTTKAGLAATQTSIFYDGISMKSALNGVFFRRRREIGISSPLNDLFFLASAKNTFLTSGNNPNKVLEYNSQKSDVFPSGKYKGNLGRRSRLRRFLMWRNEMNGHTSRCRNA